LSTTDALEWRNFEPLAVAEALGPEVREGIAYIAAHRLSETSETGTAIRLLKGAFHDPSPEVRKSAAGFAAPLRGEPLRPFAAVISEFIASPAFSEGIDQLLITLEDAPDKTDDLVLLSVVRFVTVAGTHVSDISTHAAAASHHVMQLILRGLTQASDADQRLALLDTLDDLLRLGAFGIDEMVSAYERT
jgi:hypothetical protein